MFINFLKQEGILIKFFLAMLAEEQYHSFAALGKAMTYKHYGFMVEIGFDWINTKEGWKYWSKVEEKWYRYYVMKRNQAITYPQNSKGYESFSPLHTEFYNFLRKRGALSNYLANVRVNNGMPNRSEFKARRMSSSVWIGRAFTWCDTKEGYGYWQLLAHQWRAYLIGRAQKPSPDWGKHNKGKKVLEDV